MPIVTDNYMLSLTQDNRVLRVRCSQNDTSRQVNFTIYNNGMPFTIPSGLSVSVRGIKQNGNIFTKSCTYSGSVVTLVLGTQITNIVGISVAELVFTNSSGGKIGTSNFIFQVESDPLLRGTIDVTEETPTEYISDLISMVEALSARVNNIITPAGEASLSEVVDARLSGYSGTTYQNLKARIDADFAALVNTKADKSDTYTKEEVDAAIDNVTITVDETLSVPGAPADSKKVGDKISEINGSLDTLKSGRFTLTSSNIIQGTYNSSGAVVANDSRIRNGGFLPVSNGQILKFKPGTVITQFIYGMYDTSKKWLGETGFIASESEIRVSFDGYIITAFANSTKTEIVPSDFDAVLSIAEKWGSADSDIKKELGNEINDKLPVLNKESTNGITITEKQLDFNCVGALLDGDGRYSPAQTGYNTTDYIPLKNITGIYRTGTTTKFSLWTYCFYDAEKQLLGFKATTTDYTIETYHGVPVTWLNIDDYPTAKYIRITLQPSRPYTYHAVSSQPEYIYSVPQIRINGVNPLSGLKFAGKKIVNFGDSIFGNFRDSNTTTDKSISRMIAESTGATVYNCGFGGCRMGYHSEKWRAFSMYALADAITTGVWTDQDAAIDAPPSGMPSYFSETLVLLKSMDFNNVDYITIGYGVNDFTGNSFIDAQSSLTEVEYFKGALEYSLRTILSTYPNIRIVVITPCWIWYPDAETGLLDHDSDDPTAVNTRNLTLPDYVNACKTVCEKYHVPCIDTYTELGFNPYSYKAYFNVKGIDGSTASDGTHPKQAGRQLRADRIVGQMYSLF